MSDESLIRAMPDLVTFVRPDGVIMEHFGGRTLPFLAASGEPAARRIQELFEPAAGALILRLVRRVITDRVSCEAEFEMGGFAYLVRVHPQGPERALCVMRHVADDPQQTPYPVMQGANADGFPGRLRDAVVQAGLRERTFALCAIFLDGLSDIAELIDFSVRQQILDAALARFPAAGPAGDSAPIVGIIGDALLGAIVTADNRDAMRSVVESIAARMSEPVHLDDARFVLSPHIGVAIFGEDASSPQTLMRHARAAMLEARRSRAGSVQFYSDTVRMLPVMRLDIERELRKAIQDGEIQLYYRGRHDLSSGRLTGLHASMLWVHPLRGEIPPAEFLRIAETTDLAPAVSRAALDRLALDLPTLRRRFGGDFPICFGPLRHHLSDHRFLDDFLGGRHAGTLTSGGMELRIAERTLAALSEPARILEELEKAGVGCVVDELGSGTSSLAQLAGLPIAALQITRRFVVSALHDARSLRTCRTIAALAAALGVPAIAPGIDDEPNRAGMSEIGCSQGLGDLYPPVESPHEAPRANRRAGPRGIRLPS